MRYYKNFLHTIANVYDVYQSGNPMSWISVPHQKSNDALLLCNIILQEFTWMERGESTVEVQLSRKVLFF